MFWKKRNKFSWKAGLFNAAWVVLASFVYGILVATNSYAFGTIFKDVAVTTILTRSEAIMLVIMFVITGYIEPKIKGA